MEHVVLLTESGEPVGTAPKSEVHTDRTPLHLAFSCYVLDDDGRLLVSRRALSKKTWPGVWTNAFCGHPASGESLSDAVDRRAREELGARVRDVRLVLPEFRYTARDDSGIVENEICPVHLARLDAPLSPYPGEVMATAWVPAESLATAVSAAPFAFSPWLALQLPGVLAAIREGAT